jgi:hypothetical protein
MMKKLPVEGVLIEQSGEMAAAEGVIRFAAFSVDSSVLLSSF